MKKLSIILLAAMALVATSCQDETTNAVPTVNPQLPLMADEDLQVEATVASSVNLIEATAAEAPIEIAKLNVCKNVPADYTLKFVGTLAREAEYTHTADFDLTATEDGKLVVTPQVLEDAYVAAVGKSAKPKDVFFRIAAYGVKDKSEVRIGEPDYYVCQGTTNITPIDLGLVIENGYGLLGTINGWSVATALPMTNSGVSGYDDPKFSIVVSISAADAESGWWWKVVPQSTIDAGDWVNAKDASFGPAVNGDASLDGNLIGRTETQDSQAGCIKTAGIFRLTIDMENRSYAFEPVFDLLYVVGDPSWSHATAPLLTSSVGGTTFKGFATLSGYFKFTDQANWNGTNYGAGEEEGLLSTNNGADNLHVTKKALYFINVDTKALTYKLTEVTSCGLTGDFNNWGTPQELTTTDGLVWKGKLTVSEGQGWKIKFNDDWGINLGGELNNLTVDGANIVVAAGTYDVTLDITNVPYKITLTK